MAGSLKATNGRWRRNRHLQEPILQAIGLCGTTSDKFVAMGLKTPEVKYPRSHLLERVQSHPLGL
jgi:hypothetical protein